MTVKAKPDVNPYMQIQYDMQEKRFKAEKDKSFISCRFLWGSSIVS